MQGLADGYFVLPQTIGNYLAAARLEPATGGEAFRDAELRTSERIDGLLKLEGKRSVESIHRELGRILWEACGMSRNRSGLVDALERIPQLRDEFWQNAAVPGAADTLNMALEKAGRVADFLELGELMCRDALAREESCGCHLREEYQTSEGEAQRRDDEFCHVAAWEHRGADTEPALHHEHLNFEEVALTERSYK
jgi:succinate dehydrogenase / fumarate reductase flavoprotein subunit